MYALLYPSIALYSCFSYTGSTERHVLITGLRGVGKTVLLNEFEVLCQEAGWPGETKEIGRNTSRATLIGRTARKALLQMSARKRAGELHAAGKWISPCPTAQRSYDAAIHPEQTAAPLHRQWPNVL